MKYVYVILSGCYGDEGIVKIYSSRKRAEDALQALYADKYGKQGKPWIEQWEVNV